MSGTKHTSGPWLAAEAISSRVGLPVVKSGESPAGRLICNVNCVTDYTFGKQPGDDAFNREALANARLIAAAPDLLEAVKEAQAALSDGAFEGPHVDAALRTISSVIAKAEGRS